MALSHQSQEIILNLVRVYEVRAYILTGFSHLIVYWYLKTFIIMSRHKVLFYGAENSTTSDTELECFVNYQNSIFISISDGSGYESYIVLDIPTAIKLAKTIRTEINKAKSYSHED